MRHRLPGSAGSSPRALVVALLLVGFGLWQAWDCTDGMMTSPMAATTMTVTMSHVSPDDPMTLVAHLVSDQAPAPGSPSMAGLCITVLASLGAALVLLGSPLTLLGMLRRLGVLARRPVRSVVRAPALAQLCVSRT